MQVSCSRYPYEWNSNGSAYILSFDVKEQLMMVIQNSCMVNREHAHICSGVLWTWLDQTQWSRNTLFQQFWNLITELARYSDGYCSSFFRSLLNLLNCNFLFAVVPTCHVTSQGETQAEQNHHKSCLEKHWKENTDFFKVENSVVCHDGESIQVWYINILLSMLVLCTLNAKAPWSWGLAFAL